ncbi:MAG: L-ribulose-5-phosphate 4-epimerase [Chloroflexi bacterium RBG_16_51_16]|nr:MAG: L-ribulose-5-phosphate 4-epimerase [Chloroflexi bacterium RBG_16_51_16]
MKLESLRSEICSLNQQLLQNDLVAWTSGNVSGRDKKSGLLVIKPSGIRYEELTPRKMVVVDLDGKVVEGDYKPSSDTFAHVYVYRHRPDVHGVVHTHSCFATAWAAAGRSIPPILTAICDEFGGAIPLGAYAKIGGDEIGREIIRSIGESPAILMKNHGVFTIGVSPEAAVKTAVMVEDAARTAFYAFHLGTPDEIPADEVARAHRRYVEEYGQ